MADAPTRLDWITSELRQSIRYVAELGKPLRWTRYRLGDNLDSEPDQHWQQGRSVTTITSGSGSGWLIHRNPDEADDGRANPMIAPPEAAR